MSRTIVVLPGDGIGPEVTAQAVRVLETVSEHLGLGLKLQEAPMGGAALDACGQPLPDPTFALCQRASAVFLGAVGGPQWADAPVALRPEQGLLALRKGLALYANLRPVKPLPELAAASPLKADRLAGVDLMVVRELTGGIYFGKRNRTDTEAYDTCEYSVDEIERICRTAGRLARERRKMVTSVDKFNVLDTSRLWRATATRVFRDEFQDVTLEHMLVDTAAMQIVSRPAAFDVVVTDNMFGDILTDEASVLAGSMGLLPSASFGESGAGLYEPVHGSAPDIAGRGVANPCGALLSVALMLRYSLGAEQAATAVETAVTDTLKAGIRTRDLVPAGAASVGTEAFGTEVLKRLTF